MTSERGGNKEARHVFLAQNRHRHVTSTLAQYITVEVLFVANNLAYLFLSVQNVSWMSGAVGSLSAWGTYF